jgi:16S rRNA (guanine527-N7)-methyltransferase
VPGDTHDVLNDVLERARTLGVLGPGPVIDHVDHAQVFLDALVGCAGPVLDLGSGAGVPGLVIATARPDLHVTLLDSLERRTALLREAIVTLGLTERVDVLHGRAESFGRQASHRGQFEAVTARSFGPPGVVAECAAPFLRRGGVLIVSEPPDAPDRWPPDGLAQLGLTARGTSGGVAVLEQIELCPDRYPRRVGLPTKRPLF